MRRLLANSLLSGMLLVCFGGTGHPFDLGPETRKAIEERLSPPREPAQTQPEARSGADADGLFGFSEADEIAIGRQAAGALLGAVPLVKDAGLQRYVNRVGRWVASQSERADLAWHFGVIDSDDVNAFAAPGGYVFVTKGLYRVLQSESELAGVLAHEIGHVIAKHHLTILQQSRWVDLGSRLLAQTVGDSQAIARLIGAGAELFARSLDRDAEHEADRMAMVLAARAGYDPFGLPTVLQDIGHAAKDDSRVRLLFATHPHPDDRLAHLGDAAGNRLDALKGQTLERRYYRLRP